MNAEDRLNVFLELQTAKLQKAIEEMDVFVEQHATPDQKWKWNEMKKREDAYRNAHPDALFVPEEIFSDLMP